MNLKDLVDKYISFGYKRIEATSKASQDVILNKIAKSDLKDNITIKGGVVIHNLSKDIRRATRDIDLDFIKYSLDDISIFNFINKLNKVNDEIKITVNGTIEKLHHQDYEGKRVNIMLNDKYNNILETKLDIGVNTFLKLVKMNCFLI